MGQKTIARPLRDFLLLFLNRVKFEDFEEHKVFLQRITESGSVNRKTLLAAILLSFCRLAKDVEIPIGEVKSVLDEFSMDSSPESPKSPLKDSGGEEFHHLLRRLRKEKGFTLVALAEGLGIARGYLHNIERGKVVPSYALIEKAAAILDPDGKERLFLSGVVAKIPPQYRACLARTL